LRIVCAAQRNSVSGWKKMVGRIEPVHLETPAGAGDRVQLVLQALDIGRLLDRVDKALIPQPRFRECSAISSSIPAIKQTLRLRRHL